ncbi:MAG TPA: hypothetical protein EYP22_00475 [Methanosarcinales archaeon]|nr:hypothetical protein [Methanosarcinales archaeon]
MTNTVLNTSMHSIEESTKILQEELSRNPLLIFTGPQGGGKTTLAINMLSENVGAIFEGRVRSAQPVIIIRKDLTQKMKETIADKRKLPIYDDSGEEIYVDVSLFDTIKSTIENVFDILELGEDELIEQIKNLATKVKAEPKVIEIVANPRDLIKRRMNRHYDAKQRLNDLLYKEKKYGIESNILGIQGAKVADIVNREGVCDYGDYQISRTMKDFYKVIPTEGKSITECLKEMIEVSIKENRESGFLVLHKEDEQEILSDIVVGSDKSLIGVTLLEIYVGYHQKRSITGVYEQEIDGIIELIHSHIGEDNSLFSADIGASKRFGIIVSVIDKNKRVDSTDPFRKMELEEMIKYL